MGICGVTAQSQEENGFIHNKIGLSLNSLPGMVQRRPPTAAKRQVLDIFRHSKGECRTKQQSNGGMLARVGLLSGKRAPNLGTGNAILGRVSEQICRF